MHLGVEVTESSTNKQHHLYSTCVRLRECVRARVYVCECVFKGLKL